MAPLGQEGMERMTNWAQVWRVTGGDEREGQPARAIAPIVDGQWSHK